MSLVDPPPSVAPAATPAPNPADAVALARLEQQLWAELQQAVGDRSHDWRSPVLATVDAAGLPDARTVILREVDAAARQLVIYTDERSPKVAQLLAQPQAVMVFWSAALGWQLRATLRLAVQNSGLAVSSRWARLKMTRAAQDYLSPLAPGSALQAPAPVRDSREHFAVITGEVLAMDWLALAPEGHRRARFAPGEPAAWLQP